MTFTWFWSANCLKRRRQSSWLLGWVRKMRKFTVDVTQTVEVTLDETKFTPEFFAEYNETIT